MDIDLIQRAATQLTRDSFAQAEHRRGHRSHPIFFNTRWERCCYDQAIHTHDSGCFNVWRVRMKVPQTIHHVLIRGLIHHNFNLPSKQPEQSTIGILCEQAVLKSLDPRDQPWK
jgi:hypothetical protein